MKKNELVEGIKQHRKLVAVVLCMVLVSSVGSAFAAIYWTRTIRHGISVTGISAELLGTTRDHYVGKVPATDLINNQVRFTIYAENFYNIWLNITFTSDAEGLVVDATGQYQHYDSSSWVFSNVGSPIVLNGYTVIDKTQVMYATSGSLLISFSFNTEGVTLPGNYNVDLLFQAGYV